MEIRLQKWLADTGAASRRKAEEMIAAGRVAVNGQVVTTQGQKADTQEDTVTLDGRVLYRKTEYVYLLLHKPESVVTTVSDPQGRPVVMDFVPESPRVFPVGRLDYDTSGLLLLTNDGALTQALTHPRHAVPKKYTALLKGVPSKEAIKTFRTGLLIDERRTAPCDIKLMRTQQNNGEKQAQVSITLREGRNRQIRKMCDAIGHPVLSLKRVAIGAVGLGDLPRGRWRYLTEEELYALTSSVHS